MKTDPRIDAFIAKAAPFAQPILTELRARIHRALPDTEEGIKWGMPHFMIGGKNVAGMSAFKAHCAFIIHGDGRQGEAMGGYGKIADVAEIPPYEEMAQALHAARERIASHGSATKGRGKPQTKPDIPVPQDFAAALRDCPAAQTVFDGLAPSHRREYLEWIIEAKRDATRSKRIAQAIEWLAEGKKRNWKYEKC